MWHPKLPWSKSLANRIMVKRAVMAMPLPAPDKTWSEDIQAMHRVLTATEVAQAGEAGTAFRFGMAYWASMPGKHILLTGSQRLLRRPIEPLVSALKQMGASLHRVDHGWKIAGQPLSGGRIDMAMNVSSQFASALLLIEPRMAEPLILPDMSDMVSLPYVQMSQWVNPETWPPEPDWSSAIVFALAAVIEGKTLRVNLNADSLQGDAAWIDWGLMLGFRVTHEANSLVIHPGKPQMLWDLDLREQPDLAQPLVMASVALGVEAQFSGLSTLMGKEIDRMRALKDALKQLNVMADVGIETIALDAREWQPSDQNLSVDASGDHRMAFAWALMSLVQPLQITGESSVSKSFPDFWSEWKALFKST